MPASSVNEGFLRAFAAGETSMTFTAIITLVRKIDERPKPEPKPEPEPELNHSEPSLFCPTVWDQEPGYGPSAISSDIF